MQDIISMDVFFASSEAGFSLDELVYRSRELFDTEGLPGLLGLILRLVDERVCRRWIDGQVPADKAGSRLPRGFKETGRRLTI